MTEPASSNDLPEVAPPQSTRRMSMTIINFWLDACLLANVIFIMWISTMMRVVFPPPTYAAGWTLWGLTYDQWESCQFYSLCLITLLILEHLVFHWSWVCNVIATRLLKTKTRPDEGAQAIYGVGTFVGILLTLFVSLLLASLSVREPQSDTPPSPESSRP